MKDKILKPIKEKPDYFDAIEQKLIDLFKEEIYLPLIKEIGIDKKILKNSMEDLADAIKTGRVTYYRGHFKGRFSAEVSKELKRLGAQWDRKQGSWKIPQSSLPMEIDLVIRASEAQMIQKLSAIDKKLANIVPEQIAEKVQLSKLFDITLWRADRDFQKTVKGLTVAPELTAKQREIISKEWSNNMAKYVQDFTQKEIKKLRSQIQENVLEGNRFEQVVKTIQKSFDVSQNKAKFLARQETSLMMAKFKETRYQDAGVQEYIWTCSAGSANHPVRPWHKALDGKKFRWDKPPITTKPGEPIRRNNPGEDYNCRCFARPVVKFK